MKRIVIVILVLAIAAGSFLLGRSEGVRHAIEDSEIWTDESTDQPTDDREIVIELDGQIYAHYTARY